ncbi:hypothetical protein OHA72_51785 [Dactylosporangium sp. NBC_01737]|uniref:hypothetical protein n=1 Tax=Dactylosporangium sp. NBC_01737 TaxID=2975959 RepID=UPI002E15C4C0|nr:hypothetical protein OHA72_51785 [Dactylosporangium sp. NBC_01737]
MHARRSGLLTAAALLALAACTGSPTTTTPTPGASTTAAAGRDDCGGAVTKVQERLARPGVQGVKAEGQCTTVVVTTTLSDGDAGTARQLCDLAAEVAYTGDVKGIRVLGQSGKELAQGISGAKCI